MSPLYKIHISNHNRVKFEEPISRSLKSKISPLYKIHIPNHKPLKFEESISRSLKSKISPPYKIHISNHKPVKFEEYSISLPLSPALSSYLKFPTNSSNWPSTISWIYTLELSPFILKFRVTQSPFFSISLGYLAAWYHGPGLNCEQITLSLVS